MINVYDKYGNLKVLTNVGSSVESDPIWLADKPNYLTIVSAAATYSLLGHTHTFSSITSKPTTLSGYGITDAVPSSRTLTINGTTLDLSANRSWTISGGSFADQTLTADVNIDGNGQTYYVYFNNLSQFYAFAGGSSFFMDGAGIVLNCNVDTSGTFITTGGDSTDWNTAFGWGNHASVGYLTSVPAQSFASLTGKPTTLSGYGITDAYPLSGNPSGFLTSGSLSGYLLSSTAASTYEPIITSAATSTYWRGDKTFQSLNPAVIASVLTGYTSGAGTIASTDSILQAIQKLNGNDGTKANDSAVVHLTGTETITGAKTFNTSNVTFGTTVFDVTNNRINFPNSTSSRAINLSNVGTTSADGIGFGSGVSLYRSANGTITCDASFSIISNLLIGNTGSISNGTNSNRGVISFNNTGIGISNNSADANPGLLIQNTNASSTGNIVDFKNSSAVIAYVTQAGLIKVTGFQPGYVAKTATYTITAADYVVDCTANTFTVTLPTAVGHTRVHIIKNSGAGVISIATTSSQTIDGSTTYSLSTQYKYIIVQSNGANWIIIGNN